MRLGVNRRTQNSPGHPGQGECKSKRPKSRRLRCIVGRRTITKRPWPPPARCSRMRPLLLLALWYQPQNPNPIATHPHEKHAYIWDRTNHHSTPSRQNRFQYTRWVRDDVGHPSHQHIIGRGKVDMSSNEVQNQALGKIECDGRNGSPH
jgi:hypothetical protein